MKRWIGSTLITLSLALMATTATAQMYKWVDEEGNTHYTQTPPPDREAQTIAPPPAPASAKKKADTGGDNGEELPDAPPPSADLEQEQQKQEVYKKNCEAARKNLDIYNRYRKVMVDGQVTTLSDGERAKRIQEAQKNIDKFCN